MMGTLRPLRTEIPTLARNLNLAPARVLMLDYDGTLAPFHRDPAQAVPHSGVRERLARLIADPRTRLALVSGRALDSLIPLLDLDPLPEIWGTHGWEHLSADGRREVMAMDPEVADRFERIWETTRLSALSPMLEEKPAAMAVHWRGLSSDDARALAHLARSLWEPVAAEGGLAIRAFDGGLELRATGRDKGTVVSAILGDSPPAAFAAYVGDDDTDEDAFRALEGRGAAVLAGTIPRQTAAEVFLRPPEELLLLLDLWLEEAP